MGAHARGESILRLVRGESIVGLARKVSILGPAQKENIVGLARKRSILGLARGAHSRACPGLRAGISLGKPDNALVNQCVREKKYIYMCVCWPVCQLYKSVYIRRSQCG